MSKERSSALVICGREIGARDIENITEVVRLCSSLSRDELTHTVCEHLAFVTASGRHKMKACLGLLEKLEELGELRLPAKRSYRSSTPCRIVWTTRTEPRSPITGELSDIGKVELALVSDKFARVLWDEYVDRYHML